MITYLCNIHSYISYFVIYFSKWDCHMRLDIFLLKIKFVSIWHFNASLFFFFNQSYVKCKCDVYLQLQWWIVSVASSVWNDAPEFYLKFFCHGASKHKARNPRHPTGKTVHGKCSHSVYIFVSKSKTVL